MNYRMIVSYDGAKYQGWQKNKNADMTIQTKLEKTLSRLLLEEIKVIASGRTDKGAHSLGQVINFHSKGSWPVVTLEAMINEVLPEDIGVSQCMVEKEDFHARFNAKSKVYRYRIWKKNAHRRPVLERGQIYHAQSILNVDKMRSGAACLLGEHDFKGFSSDKTKKSSIRNLYSVEIVESEDEIICYFTGNGFLYNMVRILMGTLVEIGDGTRSIDTIDTIFKEKDRIKAGMTLPAEGLCLMEVRY